MCPRMWKWEERERDAIFICICIASLIFVFLYFPFLCYCSMDYGTGYSPDVLGPVVVKDFHKKPDFQPREI